MLFQNLPLKRPYTAAGVPGSFHGRLFPTCEDLFHSAFALRWLTWVPDEMKAPSLPLGTEGGRLMLIVPWKSLRPTKSSSRTTSGPFSYARSTEIAHNGPLAILMLCRLDGSAASVSVIIEGIECLGLALVDMIREVKFKQQQQCVSCLDIGNIVF